MALYRGKKKNLICLKYGNKGGHCTTKESSFVGHMVMVVWGEEKSAMEMDYLFDMWQRVGTLDNKGRQNNYLSKKKKRTTMVFVYGGVSRLVGRDLRAMFNT